MPVSPPTACRCGGKIKAGRCDRCGPRTRRQRDTRESACARGYDRKWRKFRASYLTQNPLCVDCEAKGIYTAASDVHHVEKLSEAPERKIDESNLMALCKRCHDARTARGE